MASIIAEVTADMVLASVIEFMADMGTIVVEIVTETAVDTSELVETNDAIVSNIVEDLEASTEEDALSSGIDQTETYVEDLQKQQRYELANQLQERFEGRGYGKIFEETQEGEDVVEEEEEAAANLIDENEPEDEVDPARAAKEAAEEVNENDTPETKGVKLRQILKALFGSLGWWGPALVLAAIGVFIGTIYRTVCWLVVKVFEGEDSSETSKKCDTSTCRTFRKLRKWISEYRYWIYAGLALLSLALVWGKQYESALALGLGGAALVYLYLGPLGYVTNETICDLSTTAHLLGL